MTWRERHFSRRVGTPAPDQALHAGPSMCRDGRHWPRGGGAGSSWWPSPRSVYRPCCADTGPPALPPSPQPSWSPSQAVTVSDERAAAAVIVDVVTDLLAINQRVCHVAQTHRGDPVERRPRQWSPARSASAVRRPAAVVGQGLPVCASAAIGVSSGTAFSGSGEDLVSLDVRCGLRMLEVQDGPGDARRPELGVRVDVDRCRHEAESEVVGWAVER